MMDLPWGDEKTTQFVTNVGLITSTCPHGDNVMACEWTHHVSYMPGQIAIFVKKSSATNANIKATKEFGVNLTAADQSVLAILAGGSSGKEFDKVAILKEVDAVLYLGKNIKAHMIKGAALNIECKLIKEEEFPTHTMFVGEIVDLEISGKEPLAYHKGRYWKLIESLPKPTDKQREEFGKIREKHKK